jgi:hypothetical protein
MTHPLRRLLLLALVATAALAAPTAGACEKHVGGHQNSTDTNLEGSQK